MANTRVISNFRSSAVNGKHHHLPPKGPFPTMSSSYADHGFNHNVDSKVISRPKEGTKHQRTSSESFIIDEQPSWLDELLDEPETPVRKGAHRRSSSDSFAYMDAANFYPNNVDNLAQEEQKHRGVTAVASWGSRELDHLKNGQRPAYNTELNVQGIYQGKVWDSAMGMVAYNNSIPSPKDRGTLQDAGFAHKQEKGGSVQDSLENKDFPNGKTSQSEMDSKRAKQQYAQRSRVRKLHYIAELERNVQALQAEGMEVSAELEFMDRQNLILSLENKTLKQRVESLAQEQLIKQLQQEMLEREIARLRALFLQQQEQQQRIPIHARSSSRGLDSHFASLSLKTTMSILIRILSPVLSTFDVLFRSHQPSCQSSSRSAGFSMQATTSGPDFVLLTIIFFAICTWRSSRCPFVVDWLVGGVRFSIVLCLSLYAIDQAFVLIVYLEIPPKLEISYHESHGNLYSTVL